MKKCSLYPEREKERERERERMLGVNTFFAYISFASSDKSSKRKTQPWVIEIDFSLFFLSFLFLLAFFLFLSSKNVRVQTFSFERSTKEEDTV